MFAVRAPHAFDGERFLPAGATVLVEDGSIRGVEAYDHDLPDDIEVLDHPDATVLPGLIDAHTHLVGDSEMGALDRVEGYSDEEIDTVMTTALRRQLAVGVTTVRDLGDRSYCALERRNAQRDGSADPLEPTILAAGPPVTTPRGHCWSMGGEVADTAALRQAIADRVERGVDVVKIMASGGMTTAGTDVMGTQFSLGDLRGAVEAAHAAGLPITAHAHSLPAVEAAIVTGVDGIEHCTCLTPDGPALTAEIVERIVAAGIAVCPTLGVDRALFALVTPPPQMLEVMQRLGLDPESFLESRIVAARLLVAGGATIVTGVDSGIGAMKPHGYVAASVADLVTAGMPCSTALATATSVSADVLGLGASKGRLRSGCDADVLVVGGDLSADVERLTDVQRVVVRGQRLGSTTLGG